MYAPPQLVMAFKHLQVMAFFNSAGIAMLIYDFFLTFPQEVSLIWPAPLSLMKVLFLVTRYLPFADVGIRIWHHTRYKPSVRTCLFVFESNSWLFYVGTCLAEVILTLRTWAVWNRDWRLSIALPIFYIACFGVNIPLIVIFVKSLRFLPIPTPPLLGCLAIKGWHLVSICWTMLFVYETGIFLLMLIKGIRCYRSGGSSQLFHVVYRDGLLYYLYLFGFALANVIMVATMPPDLQMVLVVIERFIHPILACRVVLDIRGQVSNMSQSALANTITLPKPQAYVQTETDSTPETRTARNGNDTSSFVGEI